MNPRSPQACLYFLRNESEVQRVVDILRPVALDATRKPMRAPIRQAVIAQDLRAQDMPLDEALARTSELTDE